ncbi:SCO7613 C-terminal domain-containing membrane protein [Agromyces sp. M3QZ16-3]|uniref:SCO7613 C-terminal domain-containing membrane protein n=1 Tax=Agromyces sp. M3QZ16-3 TaxID=3447585 RepID=UPI003F68FCB5
MTESSRPAAPDLRRWPSDPAQFADTTLCPACFSRLRGVVCDACGLRLDVPAASDLLAAGLRVLDADTDRQSIITRMRAAQAAPPVPVDVAVSAAADATAGSHTDAPVSPTVVPSSIGAATGSHTSPSVGPASPAPPTPAPPPLPPDEPASVGVADDVAPAATPRRSGVQLLLLVLGVVLLSVAAMVFLFFAFVVADLEMRSVITAAVSVIVLVLAWFLRARRLPGTAEGVSAVGAVLLVLDAWIIQANGLFGADRADAAAYWGVALLVVAAILAAAGIISRLRLPRLAAAALAPTGVFVGASALAPDDGVATGLWLGGIALALVGAASRFIRPEAERTIVRAFGFAGGGIALATAAFALPSVESGPLWSFLAVAGVWIVVLVALPPAASTSSGWRVLSSIAVGLAVPLAFVLGIALDQEASTSVWLAPGLAAVAACAFAALTRLSAVRRDAVPALLAAAAVTVVSTLPAFVIALDGLATMTSEAMGLQQLTANAPRDLPSEAGGSVLALVIATVALTGVLALIGRLRRFAAAVIATGLATALSAAVLMPTMLAATIGLLVVAAAALSAAAIAAVRRIPGAVPVLAAGGIPAAALAWLLAHSTASLWWWVVPGVFVLTIAGRILADRVSGVAAPAVRVLHVVAASLVALLATVAFPSRAAASGLAVPVPWDDPAFLAAVVATLALGLLAAARRLPDADRLTAGAALFAGAMIGTTWLAVTLSTPWAWVPATALAVVGLAWVRSDLRPISILFAAGVPLAALFAGAGISADLDGGDVAIGMAVATLAAAAIAPLALPADPLVRRIWGITAGALTVITALVGLSGAVPFGDAWVVLLLLTPVPVLIATLFGDPIAGRSSATHASWGSLVLGVGAVWAWSRDRGVDDVEPYTLPLAAGLLITAGLLVWRRPVHDTTAAGRTALLAAAAAVAVLPSVALAGESELRTLVLVATGAVLVLAGSFASEGVRGVPVRLLVVATGWVAASGAALVRGAAVAAGRPSELPVEFWPVLALAVAFVGSVMWVRSSAVPAVVAELGIAASLTVAAVPTTVAIITGIDDELRVAALLTVLGAAYVLNQSATRLRPIAGPILAWGSLCTAFAVGALALFAGHVDPFELVTVPIGVALVAAGAIRMRRPPEIGSWAELGPGLALLMLPTLVADWTDPELWRVVALGIVAVGAVVAGAVLRLQAPLLLGGAVLLVHTVAQLWPWITLLYEAVWWWLWLGIAGVLLIVIAATYERQVRFARGAIRTISSLR